MAEKDTEVKILCRSPFRSGHMSAICARLTNKGKVGVQRGRKTAGCPSFLPPRRVPRRSRRPQTANSSAEVQRKTFRPSGANPPAAVRVPRSAGAEKEPPGKDEPLAQFVHLRSACAEKTAAAFRQKRKAEEKLLPFCTKIYLTFCEKSWYNKTLYKIGYIIRFLSIC